MLATTRAPVASRAGRSCSSQASTPGSWRPTLLSMPAGVSCTRGGGLPGPRLGRQRLDHHRAQRRQVDVGRQLGPVAGGARRRHHRVGQVHRADARRQVDVPAADRAARCSWSPSWYSCRLRTDRPWSAPVGDAAGRGQRGGDRGEARDLGGRWPRCGCGRRRRGPAAARRVDDELDLARRDQVDGVVAVRSARPPWRRRCRRARRAPRRSAVPAVATMAKPSSTKRRAATMPPGLVAVGEREEDRARFGQPVAGRDLALGEGQPEGGVDAHDLAGRAHLRAEEGVDVGEAVEREHRLLDRSRGRRRPAGAAAPRRAARRGWRRP